MRTTPPPAARTHVLILGSTGSIGRQALEVAAVLPDIQIVGLSAGRDTDLLLSQAVALGVRDVCLADAARAVELSAQHPSLAVRSGEAGLCDLVASAADVAREAGASLTVLNGIVGAAGLHATIAALEAGATLALANKESMVAGGPFVSEAAKRTGALILPVDSEHSALFQCLGGETRGAAVEELLLTGSGGPFRGRKAADLVDVTPAQALAHPTWAMGPKISVDSATLMNKGLEIIEAHRLFSVPYERITVLLNPESIVHSMVRFADGAILGHLGVPDMRTPIGYALAYPQRPVLPMVRRLDVFAKPVSFEPPDTETFPCLMLAREAGKQAARVEAAAADVRTAASPIVLNAANEVAVEKFLAGAIPFPCIPEIVERCLTWLGAEPVASLDDVYACDAEARRFAAQAVAGRC